MRMEGLGRRVGFKCEFKVDTSQIDISMIEELMKNSKLEYTDLMQEQQ